jgi:hypothetical protein
MSVLAAAQGELAAGIRGGVLPFARFRGLRVDEYQRAVGLPLPPDMTEEGFPWCASAIYTLCEEEAQRLGVPNLCPRTGGALHLWDTAPAGCKTDTPEPGAIFVLDRGHGKGHVGVVESASGAFITTVEPDTSNTSLSATGDAWGSHTWSPADRARGVLLGYLVF